jgi:hypothetical protein
MKPNQLIVLNLENMITKQMYNKNIFAQVVTQQKL